MIHDIDNHLTDHQLLTYFNPHHHEHVIKELYEDKEDLYYKSSGMTDYDNVFGITRVSVPVETLAIKSCSIDSRIELIESKFEQHTANLDDYKANLDADERNIIDEYFYQQYFYKRNMQHPLVRLMKESLYSVELDDRKDRHIQRGMDARSQKLELIRQFKESESREIRIKGPTHGTLQKEYSKIWI